MPDGADVAAQWQREEGGTREGHCGIINRHILIVVVIKYFQRRFGLELGTAVVPLPGILGPPPLPESGILPFFQDGNVLRQIQVVTPLGFSPLPPIVKLLFGVFNSCC